MRTLDIFLGSLGLVALGLMFTNSPSVQARTQAVRDSGEGVLRAQDGSASIAVEFSGDLEVAGDGETGSTPEIAGQGAPAVFDCCASLRLTPAERAARARVLEQLLSPRGNSPQAEYERKRLGLFLHLGSHLSPDEEREIS